MNLLHRDISRCLGADWASKAVCAERQSCLRYTTLVAERGTALAAGTITFWGIVKPDIQCESRIPVVEQE